MGCGKQISEVLTPVFKTDFGVKSWCQFIPFSADDSSSLEDEVIFLIKFAQTFLSI